MFIDILQAPSLLSLNLQDNYLDVVKGIHGILKSHNSLKKLSSLVPLQWPTVRVICSKIMEDPDEVSKYTYQGVSLKNYSESTKKACIGQAVSDLHRLDEKLRIRLEWSDTALLRAILLFLDTQNWKFRYSLASGSEASSDDDESLAEIKSSVEAIAEHFRAPLEAKGVEICFVLGEIRRSFCAVFQKILNIQSDTYKKVALAQATHCTSSGLICSTYASYYLVYLFQLPKSKGCSQFQNRKKS